MNDKNYLIKIENLKKEFDQPANGILKVLDGISLTFFPGDEVALMGLNGSGKTTLLRLISGELSPTSGSILFYGKNVSNLPAYKRASLIGRVHQESYKSLASELTVEELLSLAMRRNTSLSFCFPDAHNTIKTIKRFSEGAASFVQERTKLVTRFLSGGQRQLLAIIVAVLGQPKILFLDEHQASLDDGFKAVANELVHGFVAISNGAFIAATHDRLWVDMNVKKIVRLSNGNVVIEKGGFHD